jgi:hypothetical protein
MSGRHGYGGLDDLFEAAGERSGEHRALIVLGVIGLALSLILTAFFVGRGLAGDTEEASEPAAPAPRSDADSLAEAAVGGELRTGQPRSPGASPSRSAGPSSPATAPGGRLVGEPYAGPVRPAAVRGASASCVAEAGVDSGGNRVGYGPGHMLDGAASTAWRCNGNGRGVTLEFRLNGPQRIAEVGLVPGYAKTDPFSGADRYAENRRISTVRWSFDGGSWVEQTFDTGRSARDLQTLRIPPVRTRSVRVTVRDSAPGSSRNTVAVSTVRLSAPRG